MRAAGTPGTTSGSSVKRSAKVSMSVGNSSAMKSVAEGSPCGPVHCGAARRVDRKSPERPRPVGGPLLLGGFERSPGLQQVTTMRASPLHQTRVHLVDIGDHPLADQRGSLIQRHLLQLGGRPDPVLRHAPSVDLPPVEPGRQDETPPSYLVGQQRRRRPIGVLSSHRPQDDCRAVPMTLGVVGSTSGQLYHGGRASTVGSAHSPADRPTPTRRQKMNNVTFSPRGPPHEGPCPLVWRCSSDGAVCRHWSTRRRSPRPPAQVAPTGPPWSPAQAAAGRTGTPRGEVRSGGVGQRRRAARASR
jgi:hypothetical protein